MVSRQSTVSLCLGLGVQQPQPHCLCCPREQRCVSYSEQQCEEVASPHLAPRHACLPRGSTPQYTISVWGWKSQKSKKHMKLLQERGGREENGYFFAFFSPLFVQEPTLIHKRHWQPKALGAKRNRTTWEVGSKGSEKAPKGDGEGEARVLCALSRLGCSAAGNAELRSWRGAALFEQGSGAITFFFLLFQVNTLPRPPLSPSTPPPSLSILLMCFYLRAAVQTNMIGIYSPLFTLSSSL